MKSKILGLLAAGILAGPIAAEASVIGATANVDFYFPDSSTLYCSSGTAVIGAGVEYPSGCSGFSPVSIDIADGTLSVGHSNPGGFSSGTFNGFMLDIFGFDFTSASYTGGTLGVTGVSILNGNLWLNFADQVDGTANFNFAASSVPEPGTLALLGLGLAGLGLSRRRKAN